MNRRSPRRAKRVESVTDVSYEIVRRLRYDDDGDDDDDDDDHDDHDDHDDENEKNIPGIGSYALKDRRHVVVFLLERTSERASERASKRATDRPTDRSIFFSGAMCAQLAGINIFSASKPDPETKDKEKLAEYKKM